MLCSSNLLDASLPRATEPELNTTAFADPDAERRPSGSPPSNDNPGVQQSADESPPNPHQLVVLGCLPLLSLILPIPVLWRSALFAVLALVAFTLALLVKITPSSLEGRLEQLQGEGGRAQRELVDGLSELVAEAEGLDRIVNGVLRRVAEADKSL